MKTLLAFTLTILSLTGLAQVMTYEDSLNANLTRKNNPTVLSGYGEAVYSRDLTKGTAESNITRSVIFLGHKFNNKVQFFSELELEDCKIAGGGVTGEFALEQFFLKFNLNKDMYLVSGLFVPRIGIINENHLPTTFNGNNRPFLEHDLIPATWREIGVGLYGIVNSLPGLNYSISLMNGLDASKFLNPEGIREGRAEGSLANSKNLAVSASLLYYKNNFRYQVASYYGGGSGVDGATASTLGIKAGAFAMPINVNEANVQYRNNGISFKALAAHVTVKDAQLYNATYTTNTAKQMIGAYAEIGYDVFHKKYNGDKSFIFFGRFEHIDLENKMAINAIRNADNNKQHIVTGFTYLPVRGVAVKLDYHYEVNTANSKNDYFNLGFGYSF